MYLQYFGLQKNPFSLTPDPGFLFLTTKHREALAALLFAVMQRKGFMVMTGEAGTGKTTLIRKMLTCIPATCAQFSIIVNPALTRSEFFESVLMDFGETDVPGSKALRLALLKNLLLRAYGEGKTCVLVIDEAHLLTGELIEEVRLLSNFETSEQKLLQIILAGQVELNSVLNLESMRPVRQRVAIRMHIEALTDAEVKRYLQTRWSRAGTERPLPFSEDAVTIIARSSGGIPRVINVISDAALVNAYGSGVPTIGKAQIEEVLRDLGIAAVDADPLGPSFASDLPARVVNAADRIQNEPLGMKSLERYMPGKPRSPGVWKVANWFGIRHLAKPNEQNI